MYCGVCFDQDSTKVLCNPIDLVYFIECTPWDIYYGVNYYDLFIYDFPTIENIIKTTFLKASGNVGSLTGRYYNFPTGYCYKYWCIPDEPNEGTRVINEITNGPSTTVMAYDKNYIYYQENPTPGQSIAYGKITINGIIYRIYRTITRTSSYLEQYVYSFD